MGQLVYTKLGYELDDDLMDRSIHTHYGPNVFSVSTRWTMKADYVKDGVVLAVAGELMREDAAPSILAGPGRNPQVIDVVQGKINGI